MGCKRGRAQGGREEIDEKPEGASVKGIQEHWWH